MEQERWTDITIPGLDNKYQVSTMGQIKRLAYDVVSQRNGAEYIMHKNEMIVKLQNQKYQMVMLMVNGKQKAFYVHRLVAQAFIPNPDNLPEVNHINEDKYDNRVENLEWCTHSYNMNYGTRMDRVRQTQIESGNWQDYSGFSDEEKNEFRKKQMKEWREKNKEHTKEWREKNKERLAASRKKWCENNKEKAKIMRRKTYENNRAYYLDYQKKYDEKHYQKKLARQQMEEERQSKKQPVMIKKKRFLEYDENGTFIREWNSVKEIAEYYGVTGCCIRLNIDGTHKFVKQNGLKRQFKKEIYFTEKK